MEVVIEDEDTIQMAHELAELTGESIEVAVNVALFQRLLRVQKEKGVGLAERLQTIGRYTAPRLKPPYDTIDHGDLLYDEHGLPK